MIAICYHRFISCNKSPMELQSVDSGEASGVGTDSMDENSVFSAQFCCEVKSALKNKVYLKNKIKSESVKVKSLSHI